MALKNILKIQIETCCCTMKRGWILSENEGKADESLMIEYPQRIVNIDGLAEYLKATRSNLRRFWRDYPHFFVGTGIDLKAARFDIADVLLYLKISKGVGYELVAKPKGEKLEVQVREPKPEVQKREISEPTMYFDRRGRKRSSDKGSSSRRRKGAPFRLLDL